MGCQRVTQGRLPNGSRKHMLQRSPRNGPDSALWHPNTCLFVGRVILLWNRPAKKAEPEQHQASRLSSRFSRIQGPDSARTSQMTQQGNHWQNPDYGTRPLASSLTKKSVSLGTWIKRLRRHNHKIQCLKEKQLKRHVGIREEELHMA